MCAHSEETTIASVTETRFYLLILFIYLAIFFLASALFIEKSPTL